MACDAVLNLLPVLIRLLTNTNFEKKMFEHRVLSEIFLTKEKALGKKILPNNW